MIRRFIPLALFLLAAVLSKAQPMLPSSFHARTIHSPEGAEIFVRWGGSGPVVLLIHGYAENSDSWAPLAADLMKDHTVVVPDLRGIGRSSKPAEGYDKKTQAKDMRAVVTSLGYDKTFVVAHDIGNMVAYAYAAIYPDKVERLVVMDAPIPGIEPWNEILQLSRTGCGTAGGRPGADLLRQNMERLHRRPGQTGRRHQKVFCRHIRATWRNAGRVRAIYCLLAGCEGQQDL
jgi:pimeloyl-ACP methyl ester carboxylesterase